MGVAIPTTSTLKPRPDPRVASLAAASAGAVALVAIAAVLGAGAASGERGANALLRASMVAAPLGAGLFAWYVRQYPHFARLLLIIGLTTFVTTLAESSNDVLYTVGRTAGWMLEALLVAALLAFPSGRATDAGDRRLVRALWATVAIACLPTLVLTGRLAVPSPYTSCATDCPASALHATSREWAFVDPVFFGGGSAVLFLLMVAVVVRLQHHLAVASPLQRRVLVPVLVVAVVRVSAVGVLVVEREIADAPTLATAGAVLIAWCTPVLALAFLVGLLRLRLSGDRALRRLAIGTRRIPDVATLQRAFADALGDAALRIKTGSGGRVDATAARRVTTAGRLVVPVSDRHGATVATIDCDASLADCPELLDAAATIAALVLDNLRLSEQTDAATREVVQSRARIAAIADRERQRIERDLHDGAQQRLVAIRIELGLAEDLARSDPPRCAARIHALEGAMDDALEEIRALAHGICPPLLADQGLPEALRAATARCSIPASLDTRDVRRYSPEVESAVYFCVLEALQNVAKHAPEARRVTVHLSAVAGDQLRFSVRDNGLGTAGGREPRGAGITNMHDRVTAVGGSLDIRSRSGLGTEVRGQVPVPRRGSCQ
jgi:signal transduction histidine kinase